MSLRDHAQCRCSGTTLTMVWNNDCDGKWTGDVEYTLVFKQQ